ncbi:MAG: alpha/beta hydrolase [Bacillota bacterium]|nr:alpha/beta hydrolase [Bacillota bacterium]
MNKEFYLNCDGIQIHAKMDFPSMKQEKYPLFIVVHGLTGHMEEDHITAISKTLNDLGYISLRLDMFGHGKSEGDFKDHHLLLWVSELIRAIDYVRNLDFVQEVNLVSHSQGSVAVILASAIMQKYLHCIIPLSPALVLKDVYEQGSILGVPFDSKDMPENIMLKDKPLSTNHIMIDHFLPYEKSARSFNKPVLICHGDADTAVPYAYSEVLADWYENATLVKIEGDDHCFHSHLDQVLDAIRDFLKTI